MALPLFSKICMYLYCSFGARRLSSVPCGGSVIFVDIACFAKGEVGDRCAAYNLVHV